LDLERLRHSLNALLPPEIGVLECYTAPPDFHALESVTGKRYKYRLLLRRTKATHGRNQVWCLAQDAETFNLKALEAAAQDLLGEHDFFAFSASNSSTKTFRRRLDSFKASLIPHGDAPCFGHELHLEFGAKGFLKHMVRLMVGSLVEIAQGKRPVSFIRETLLTDHQEDHSRLPRMYCAPSHGLSLEKVIYEKA
jgi:tRNA pseudouridine38-40 synthase